jgi:hypothetical protein
VLYADCAACCGGVGCHDLVGVLEEVEVGRIGSGSRDGRSMLVKCGGFHSYMPIRSDLGYHGVRTGMTTMYGLTNYGSNDVVVRC